MEESEQNLAWNGTNFSSNGQEFSYQMIKQFHMETNLPFNRGINKYKINCKSCRKNLRFKSQSQLNTDNKECLVKNTNKNTQGIRRKKSQTERKEN